MADKRRGKKDLKELTRTNKPIDADEIIFNCKNCERRLNEYNICEACGRPTLYRKEYCNMIVTYFLDGSKEVYKKIETANGYKIKPQEVPTFERFSRKLGYSYHTLKTWKNKHVEFADAWERCRDIMKDMINQGALINVYNPQYAIFMQLNYSDMRKTEYTNFDPPTEAEPSSAAIEAAKRSGKAFRLTRRNARKKKDKANQKAKERNK